MEVSLSDFEKLDIRVGRVLNAERIPGSKKLFRVEVDLGEPKPRTLVAALAGFYELGELQGMNIVVLANLKPKRFMGVKSRAMLLAADVDGRPVLLTTAGDVPPGTRVK